MNINFKIINMKSQKSAKDLMNYNPYAVARQHDGYADIVFETEGVITVPRNSASNIVDLLNTAFKNGVRMTVNSTNSLTRSSYDSEPEFIPKQMPQVEPVPINLYSNRK